MNPFTRFNQWRKRHRNINLMLRKIERMQKKGLV